MNWNIPNFQNKLYMSFDFCILILSLRLSYLIRIKFENEYIIFIRLTFFLQNQLNLNLYIHL